jgi:hypothetical protein
MPLPKTGKVNTNKIEAARTVHENKHDKILMIPVLREINKEAMNVIDPPSEDNPKICNAKIARLIAELEE